MSTIEPPNDENEGGENQGDREKRYIARVITGFVRHWKWIPKRDSKLGDDEGIHTEIPIYSVDDDFEWGEIFKSLMVARHVERQLMLYNLFDDYYRSRVERVSRNIPRNLHEDIEATELARTADQQSARVRILEAFDTLYEAGRVSRNRHPYKGGTGPRKFPGQDRYGPGSDDSDDSGDEE